MCESVCSMHVWTAIALSMAVANAAILCGFIMGADGSSFSGKKTCFDAQRYMSQTKVSMYIGSPPKRADLLLRLDRTHGNRVPILKVSRRVFQLSETAVFVKSTRVYDRVLTRGIQSSNRALARTAFLIEEDHQLPADIDGFFMLPTGVSLEIYNSLVCIDEPSLDTPRFKNSVFLGEDGYLKTDVGVHPCHGESELADLFPMASGNEYEWLGLSPLSGAAEKRRADVERGLGSLTNVSSPIQGSACMALSSKTYAWQCLSGEQNCMESSSYVFRRYVGYDNLNIFVGTSRGSFETKDGPRGYQRMALSHDTEAVDAFVRLFLVLLAAAVTILRRRSKSINVRSHLTRALKECMTPRACLNVNRVFQKCPTEDPTLTVEDQTGTNETEEPVKDVEAEALVGTLAVAGRTVSLIMSADLVSNKLVVTECFAIVASVLHLISRHPPVLEICDDVSPVQKLGGSMASNDVAAALLVSLAQSPFSEGFRPVGRLLAVALISLTCLNQSIFAVVGMSLVAFTSRTGGSNTTSYGYRILCAFAAVLWCVQLFAVGFSITELFSTPFATEMHRFYTDNTLFTQLNMSLVALQISAPMRNRIVRSCYKKRV